MQIKILRGLPGAGKSTYAKRFPSSLICSADHFFTAPNGDYRFDPKYLPQAHAKCLRRYITLCCELETNAVLIVDNTNLTVVEMAPYVAVGLAFGYDVEIINIHCEIEIAAARCIHGVDASRYPAMQLKMANEILPSWWKVRTV